MAFNPDPKVAAARDFGNRFGAERVVIFYALPDGRYGYASYGKTPALCKATRKEADSIFEAVEETFAAEADL